MDKYRLPTKVDFDGTACNINTDYRDVLMIFKILSDPDLLDSEKITVALEYFYEDETYYDDIDYAIDEMFQFLTACSDDTESNTPDQKPLYDWEQDFNIIIAPINKIIGIDVRGLEYLHWWTFLSAFMEIGECTFNTFVGIRDKLNKGKKLDKSEEKIYRENRNKILLKKKYDSTTQALMDEILGKG